MRYSAVAALTATAFAALLAVAPTASAAPAPTPKTPACNYVAGDDTVCQTPGNVQVNSSPPPLDYGYGYGAPWLVLGSPGFIGGYGFGGGHGGFGGGHGGLGGHR